MRSLRFLQIGLGLALILVSLLITLALRQEKQKYHAQLDLKSRLETQLTAVKEELEALKNVDQKIRNDELQAEIDQIEQAYQKAVEVYENLLTLKEKTTKTSHQDEQFAESLALLSQRNYASASAGLTKLDQEIDQEKTKIIAAIEIPENIPENNQPPDSGYRRQKVTTEVGSFMVSLVVADLNSTRVIVDTAADSDCADNCPVLPLATYVARNGAFAGINGSYFCPATYPSCAGKTNSFDTLLMNKNKVYFNSDNNVYSTNPAVIFSGNSARFVTQSLQWGRDTGVDAVIANHPLLTLNNQIYFTGQGESSQGVRGNRSFVGTNGTTVYLGVVHNASVAQAAQVVQALGIANALNLDDGGSTALWSGGYKVGPGRNLPNALLFVRK